MALAVRRERSIFIEQLEKARKRNIFARFPVGGNPPTRRAAPLCRSGSRKSRGYRTSTKPAQWNG